MIAVESEDAPQCPQMGLGALICRQVVFAFFGLLGAALIVSVGFPEEWERLRLALTEGAGHQEEWVGRYNWLDPSSDTKQLGARAALLELLAVGSALVVAASLIVHRVQTVAESEDFYATAVWSTGARPILAVAPGRRRAPEVLVGLDFGFRLWHSADPAGLIRRWPMWSDVSGGGPPMRSLVLALVLLGFLLTPAAALPIRDRDDDDRPRGQEFRRAVSDDLDDYEFIVGREAFLQRAYRAALEADERRRDEVRVPGLAEVGVASPLVTTAIVGPDQATAAAPPPAWTPGYGPPDYGPPPANPVPQPAAMLLLGVGLLALGVAKRVTSGRRI